MSNSRSFRCGSDEEDIKVPIGVNNDNDAIDKLVRADPAYLSTKHRQINSSSLQGTGSLQDTHNSLSRMTQAQKLLNDRTSPRRHLHNDLISSTRDEFIIISSDPSPSDMEVDSDSEPLWSLSMPEYIEGSIRTFPRSLYKSLKKSEGEKGNHMKIRCLTRLWVSSGPRKGTIYGEGEDGVTKWIIRDSGEEVDLGRFRYGTNHQLIVAQHPKFNQGRASLIYCKGSFGKERNDPNFYRIKSSRWWAYDPLPNAQARSEIERIVSFSRKRREDLTSTSQRATRTSNPEVSGAAFEASEGGEEIEMPINSQQTELHASSRISRRKKTRNCEELTTSIADPPPLYSSRSESLRAQNTLLESRLDIRSNERRNSPPRASNDKIATTQTLNVLKMSSTPQITPPSPIALDGVNKRDTRSSAEVNPTEQATNIEQTKKTESILAPLTRLDTASFTNLNNPAQHEVMFIFKETQNSSELRRRPYTLCKTVQMLYSQALAAGIAQSDTAMLSVRIQGQETRMVPRGDHLDYEEVKNAIRDAEQDAKETILGAVADIEVIVFNYEWN